MALFQGVDRLAAVFYKDPLEEASSAGWLEATEPNTKDMDDTRQYPPAAARGLFPGLLGVFGMQGKPPKQEVLQTGYVSEPH